MSIIFDFRAPDLTVKLAAVAHGTTVNATTIPLKTAGFPLTAGRVCFVEMEAVGIDSSNASLYNKAWFMAQGAATPTNGGLSGEPNPTSGASPSYVVATINASGDLDIDWQNNDSSLSHDVSILVKQRWVGNA
jgi:hypothetical protein